MLHLFSNKVSVLLDETSRYSLKESYHIEGVSVLKKKLYFFIFAPKTF